jgi:hypothetical protein
MGTNHRIRDPETKLMLFIKSGQEQVLKLTGTSGTRLFNGLRGFTPEWELPADGVPQGFLKSGSASP